jgi:hypothetical protein
MDIEVMDLPIVPFCCDLCAAKEAEAFKRLCAVHQQTLIQILSVLEQNAQRK